MDDLQTGSQDQPPHSPANHYADASVPAEQLGNSQQGQIPYGTARAHSRSPAGIHMPAGTPVHPTSSQPVPYQQALQAGQRDQLGLQQQLLLARQQGGQCNPPYCKYYMQRVTSNVAHVLFYVVNAEGAAKLAVVGTDVKMSGHFVYASVSDISEAPALRCTNRGRVIEWLNALGASEAAEDHEVMLPELTPLQWQQLNSADPLWAKPQLDRQYTGYREEVGVLQDGRHYKNYYLVDDEGHEKLMVQAEDGVRLDRRYTYKATEEVGGFCFENGRAVTDWLDFVLGKIEHPPSFMRRDGPPEPKRRKKKQSSGDKVPTSTTDHSAELGLGHTSSLRASIARPLSRGPPGVLPATLPNAPLWGTPSRGLPAGQQQQQEYQQQLQQQRADSQDDMRGQYPIVPPAGTGSLLAGHQLSAGPMYGDGGGPSTAWPPPTVARELTDGRPAVAMHAARSGVYPAQYVAFGYGQGPQLNGSNGWQPGLDDRKPTVDGDNLPHTQQQVHRNGAAAQQRQLQQPFSEYQQPSSQTAMRILEGAVQPAYEVGNGPRGPAAAANEPLSPTSMQTAVAAAGAEVRAVFERDPDLLDWVTSMPDAATLDRVKVFAAQIVRYLQLSAEGQANINDDNEVYSILQWLCQAPMSLRLLEMTGICRPVAQLSIYGGQLQLQDMAKRLTQRWKRVASAARDCASTALKAPTMSARVIA